MNMVLSSSGMVCMVLFGFNEELVPVAAGTRALCLGWGQQSLVLSTRLCLAITMAVISESCIFLFDNKYIEG